LEVVKLLLQDPRVNPKVRNNNIIRSASYRGDIEVVKLLANHQTIKTPKKADLAILNIVLRALK